MDNVIFILIIGAIVVGVPFILPIVAWGSAHKTRARLADLEELVRQQQRRIDTLIERVEGRGEDAKAKLRTPAEAPEAVHAPPPAPAPAPAVAPPSTTPAPPPIVPAPPAAPTPSATPAVPPEPLKAPAPIPPPVAPSPTPPPSPAASRPAPLVTSPPVVPPPRRPPQPPVPPPPPPADADRAAFDWENLVGVKLFSAIAGIALVIAAVSFLRYSIEHGWIEPPVRVAIGVIAAVGLLALCELKAARKYPVTANALDAAAIAILFATFFAAHALWDLIGSLTTFGLLALVTVVAVLLSIRRDSLFIAVLGLLGGFATPVLLSTGENQPIPLFAYLLMLNIGLAWVAHQKRWTVLSILTVVLTTLYQWGWVIKFLSVSQVPLAMGIFVVFPVAAFAMRLLRGAKGAQGEEGFERSAVLSAALPLLFVVYLAAVPEYGVRAGLLFGYLFLLVAGLFAIAVGRRQELLHALGGAATLLVFAVHRVHHAEPVWQMVLFASLFVVFFLAAPAIAARAGRHFSETGKSTLFVAPLLLAVPASLAGEPPSASPGPLFSILFALVCAIAWRAMATGLGALYFVAIFFVVAGESFWLVEHLTIDRMRSAIVMLSIFGVLQLAVPMAARRWYAPLRPASGAGLSLIASLTLLVLIATAPIAPQALWGLALLLGILNAALFVETAAAELPTVSIVGSVMSWVVLIGWLAMAEETLGILPSLLMLTGLSLVMLAGYAWSYAQARRAHPDVAIRFSRGAYLALTAHVFLAAMAGNRPESIPPWPLFGSLFVLTLALSVTALFTRGAVLHLAGVAAASVVLLFWSQMASPAPWPSVSLIAGAVFAGYSLAWIRLVPRVAREWHLFAAALTALFMWEGMADSAANLPGAPAFGWIVASHAVALATILAVTWVRGWHRTGLATAAAAAAALAGWSHGHHEPMWWKQHLIFAGTLYAVLTGYPFVLGRRVREHREPYVLAVLSSAIFFFAADTAFRAGNLQWAIGVVPVAEGLVMALLLRQLLRLEPAGTRDLGRLALVAGTALAFATVAIPLQLKNQWITIGWAFEGAALAWLYTRIPHRGLLGAGAALLATAFVRLALNPAVFRYEPRGAIRIFNWYLYAYVLCAGAMLLAGWWFSKTDDRLGKYRIRARQLLPAGAAILLFELLNIEIADFYAAGPEITFRFGATLAQDLTYTFGWLGFGMLLLAAGIVFRSHAARVAAVLLIAVTTFKCFLYDLSSLGGLYRVASFVGLGISLALVSIALQKFVLSRPQEKTP